MSQDPNVPGIDPIKAAPMRSFRVEALNVRVHLNQVNLAAHAASAAQSILSKAIAEQGSAAVILATGNSQLRFLDALVAQGGVDWSRVTLFHMDEYLGIEATHMGSFRRYMREKVEQRLKPRTFQYIEGDCSLPLVECRRYTDLLVQQPIDLCCLGIGENGHLAFNDPPVADFNDPDRVKLVKLDDACRQQQVGEGYFVNLAAVPQYAFTLTIPMLCSARKMLCIVPEQRKAAAVKAALEGPLSTACPASHLRKQSHCTLFLDRESAGSLRQDPET